MVPYLETFQKEAWAITESETTLDQIVSWGVWSMFLQHSFVFKYVFGVCISSTAPALAKERSLAYKLSAAEGMDKCSMKG